MLLPFLPGFPLLNSNFKMNLKQSFLGEPCSLGRKRITVSAKQILVIDDEDDIRKLTQTCLEMMGLAGSDSQFGQ